MTLHTLVVAFAIAVAVWLVAIVALCMPPSLFVSNTDSLGEQIQRRSPRSRS